MNNRNKSKETLTKEEHRLLVEGYSCDQMLGIYNDLTELEVADLTDFFNLERENGGSF